MTAPDPRWLRSVVCFDVRSTLGATLAATLALAAGCSCAAETPPTPDAGLDAPGAACTTSADCDDDLFCTGLESCVAGGCVAFAACRDGQVCDEANLRCFTSCSIDEDADRDGARAEECGGLDCDDTDPDRAPGIPEICDTLMHDEDCDPLTFGFRDSDGDGAADARCCNVDPTTSSPTCGIDCDDTRPGVSPFVPDVCNAIDDDCDGAADEGLRTHVYLDADGDGHGVDVPAAGEEADVCDVEPGWSRTQGDCDDGNPLRFVGNPEVCDIAMLDEDCSGMGNDVPGGCDCTGTVTESCGTVGVCAGATHTCMADGRWSPCTRVPSTEVCDTPGTDEDCDGMVNEDLTAVCYTDTDRDGYAPDGAAATPTCRSTDASRSGAPWMGCPLGLTGRAPAAGTVDCCDSDSRAHPGAGFATTPRACGASFDFDCDGTVTREQPNTAQETCASNCSTGGAGWCFSAAPPCGGSGRYSTGCWNGFTPCVPTSCWPTTVRCR